MNFSAEIRAFEDFSIEMSHYYATPTPFRLTMAYNGSVKEESGRPVEEQQLTSAADHLMQVIQTVNIAIICQIIDVFGTVTNVVNIIVFAKIGFKESINVSLFCLAISDLASLVTLIWHNVCFNPLFRELDLSFDPMDVQYLSGGWPHVTFTRVTTCITAFITVERCLCITIPMKVKRLVTPGRVAVVNLLIFVALVLCVCPIYVANRLGAKFSPLKNKTLVGLVFRDDRDQLESVSFTINNILIPFVAFAVVVVCTVVLVVKLRSKRKWRERSIGTEQASQHAERDQKVARMVVMLSTLFIVCFFPLSAVVVAMIFEPELAIYGRYRNIFFTVNSFAFVLESINSSVNIFFYYSMSSKYRAVLDSWFCRPRMEKKT